MSLCSYYFYFVLSNKLAIGKYVSIYLDFYQPFLIDNRNGVRWSSFTHMHNSEHAGNYCYVTIMYKKCRLLLSLFEYKLDGQIASRSRS